MCHFEKMLWNKNLRFLVIATSFNLHKDHWRWIWKINVRYFLKLLKQCSLANSRKILLSFSHFTFFQERKLVSNQQLSLSEFKFIKKFLKEFVILKHFFNILGYFLILYKQKRCKLMSNIQFYWISLQIACLKLAILFTFSNFAKSMIM